MTVMDATLHASVKNRTGWLTRPLVWRITPAALILAGLVLLSTLLHLVNLDAIGDANTYYTAAVKSMLQSWENFFFVAAEPGGSVTVDKPPLGLWVQAVFALVLGVSGASVSLPNILSGLLSVPLLYHLVKRFFGTPAGLVAALVMAVTPVVVATDRNNTMDGMLTFTLLLAAWAFIRATERGGLGWLLLGAFLVGLGFNIKMLQAFLPLPAFYALYFFGAKTGWGRKIIYLLLATFLLLAVSLSWALVVDAVPAENRPYIGSSENNTVMELIVGHNGLSRLFGHSRAGGGAQPAQGDAIQPPRPMQNNGQAPNQANAQGDGMFNQEIGQAGLLRFFKTPLAKEMSWLLPFALAGLVLAGFGSPLRIPLVSSQQRGLVLWGGWLLTCLAFFSVASFFHAYYMIMLAPALGAMVGAGFAALQEARLAWWRWLLAVTAITTLVFQVWLAGQYGVSLAWGPLAAVLLLVGLAMTLTADSTRHWMRRSGGLLALLALVAIPLVWTIWTVADDSPNVNLPAAYAGKGNTDILTTNAAGVNSNLPAQQQQTEREVEMLSFLQANTQDSKYLLAVPSAQMGAPLVLATGRPVLYMGGFNGGDPVVDADDLAQLVTDGDLRYVLFGGRQNGADREIAAWLESSCTTIERFSQPALQGDYPPRNDQPGAPPQDGPAQNGPPALNGQPGIPQQQTEPVTLYLCTTETIND